MVAGEDKATCTFVMIARQPTACRTRQGGKRTIPRALSHVRFPRPTIFKAESSVRGNHSRPKDTPKRLRCSRCCSDSIFGEPSAQISKSIYGFHTKQLREERSGSRKIWEHFPLPWWMDAREQTVSPGSAGVLCGLLACTPIQFAAGRCMGEREGQDDQKRVQMTRVQEERNPSSAATSCPYTRPPPFLFHARSMFGRLSARALPRRAGET